MKEVEENEESVVGACPPGLPASLRFLRLCVADIRELQPSVLMSEEVYTYTYVRAGAALLFARSLISTPPLYIFLPRSSFRATR